MYSPTRSDTFATNTTRNRNRPFPNLKIQLPATGGPRQHSFPAERDTTLPNHFVGEATEIIPNVFVGDIVVAKNGKKLNELGITHIINCVAQSCQNYFPNDFIYMKIMMKDNPSEDIFCLFYDAIDFIEEATKQGKILIHCKCGISRSTAICIAYIMYKNKCTYRKAFEVLQRNRSICSPNAGFIIALQSWQSHLSGKPLEQPHLYKIENLHHKIQVMSYKLESTFCFVLHTNDAIYLWTGSDIKTEKMEFALHFISQLQKYENASNDVIIEVEGKESHSFCENLAQIQCRT